MVLTFVVVLSRNNDNFGKKNCFYDIVMAAKVSNIPIPVYLLAYNNNIILLKIGAYILTELKI